MANNNECALSQTSGYTSNSNSTNNFDLKEIGGIELDSGQYGVDLSGRLADINENFNKIFESDFLRGAPGRSIGISTWVFNNETKDTHIGQSLVDAIMSNNLGQENNALKSSIVGALMDKEIKVIYDEAGTIVSSLPFTFIDKRFYDGKTLDKSLANETDLSCVLVYETTSNSGGFVAAQTFPTLYWDAGLDGGNFCWKINGQKTGLPCKGPRGNDGSGGTLYTVIYDPTVKNVSNGSSACEIVGVMWLDGSDVSNIHNKFIPKDQFGEKQIAIKTGDTVIAIPGSIRKDGTVLFASSSNSSIGTTITSDTTTYEYSITTAFVTNDNNYYVVISGDAIHIPYVLTGGVLNNLMNMIGEDCMLGLYIPSEKSDGSDGLEGSITKGHTLWSDRKNSSNFCIGEVVNPAAMNGWKENPELVDDPSSVSLLYDDVSVGKDAKMNISSRVGNGTHIIEMTPSDKRNVSVEAMKFKGYYYPGLTNASGLIMEYNFQSSVSIDGESHNFSTCQLIRIGGEFRHATHVIDNQMNDDHFILWDDDLADFANFLQIWLDCKKSGEHATVHSIDLVVMDVDNLRIEDGMYVCDEYTAKEMHFTFNFSNAGGYLIDEVECDDINLTYGGTEYSLKSDNRYITLESPTLTIASDIDRDKRTIIPFKHRDMESFLITEFTTSKVIDQVYIDDKGENKFDVYPGMKPDLSTWNTKYHLSPYRYSLNQKFDRYNGNFTDQYNVSSHSQYAAFDKSYIGGQNIGHYHQILDEVIACEIPEEIKITIRTETQPQPLPIRASLSISLIEYHGVWGSIYADRNMLYLIGYTDKNKHIQLLSRMADAAFKSYKYTITVDNPMSRVVGGEDTTPGSPTQSLQILGGQRYLFDQGKAFNEIIFGTIEVEANIHKNVAKLRRKYSTNKNTWVLSDGNFVGSFQPSEYIAPYIDINSTNENYWMLKSTIVDPRYNPISGQILQKGDAPDGYKYKLIFPKFPKYVLGYEYDTVCNIPNEYGNPFTPSFSTNIEWYGKDTSHSTHIEKVTYRCKEFQLNDYDLIAKIVELEDSIKALESRIVALEGGAK